MTPFLFLVLGVFASFMVTLGGVHIWCALPDRRKPAAADRHAANEHRLAA